MKEKRVKQVLHTVTSNGRGRNIWSGIKLGDTRAKWYKQQTDTDVLFPSSSDVGESISVATVLIPLKSFTTMFIYNICVQLVYSLDKCFRDINSLSFCFIPYS